MTNCGHRLLWPSSVGSVVGQGEERCQERLKSRWCWCQKRWGCPSLQEGGWPVQVHLQHSAVKAPWQHLVSTLICQKCVFQSWVWQGFTFAFLSRAAASCFWLCSASCPLHLFSLSSPQPGWHHQTRKCGFCSSRNNPNNFHSHNTYSRFLGNKCCILMFRDKTRFPVWPYVACWRCETILSFVAHSKCLLLPPTTKLCSNIECW